MEHRIRVISHGIPCPAPLGDEPDEVVAHHHREELVLPLLLVPEVSTRFDQQDVARHDPAVDKLFPIPIPAEAVAGENQHQPQKKGPGDPGMYLLRKSSTEQDTRMPPRSGGGEGDFPPEKCDTFAVCHFFIIFIRILLFATGIDYRII